MYPEPHRPVPCRLLMILLTAAGLATPPATAQTRPQPPTTHAPPTVDSLKTPEARMNGRIRIKTTGVVAWGEAKRGDISKLVLYLDGRSMKGNTAQLVDPRRELWEVRLRRTDAARDAWEAVLGSPDTFTRRVRVGLGLEDGPEFALREGSPRPMLDLVIVREGWFYLTCLIWAALIVLFCWLAANTAIIRDSPPPSPDPAPSPAPALKNMPGRELELRPYSLGRSQMAFWFFLVTTAFLAIWLITGEFHGIITAEALTLLGIGTGTALGARAIEASKRTAQAEAAPRLAALRQHRVALQSEIGAARAAGLEDPAKVAEWDRIEAEISAQEEATPESPRYRNFLLDILGENGSIALHRFQIFVWTLVLGVVFIFSAYQTLALPKFDATLLALMGISGATYLGFKIPERQT
ncbi:MAG TPA: hypothetical protein VHG28_20895 [Longimicrobiaceae bacterium]|nr:hypothetical protein [Longimicrobiaceae bacterium]